MSAREKGGPPSLGTMKQAIREVLEELGQGNFQDQAMGYGKPEAGQLVGKNNAVWAQVRLTGAGDVEVPHALGQVPVACELKYLDSPRGASPTPHATATPIRMSEWTETTCRMNLYAVTGSLDGSIAVFVVKGR